MDGTLPSPRRRERAKVVGIDQLLSDESLAELAPDERLLMLQLRGSTTTISHTQRVASPGLGDQRSSNATPPHVSPHGSNIVKQTTRDPSSGAGSAIMPLSRPKPSRLPDMELLNLTDAHVVHHTSASGRQSNSGVDATLASPRFRRAEVRSPPLVYYYYYFIIGLLV